MKKFGIILLCILGLAVVAKVAWSIAYPSGTWRYKMTVEVETPEGIKTGSAVREIWLGLEPQLLPEQGGGLSAIYGESVVIDLGKDRGLVFSLLESPNFFYKGFSDPLLG